MSKNYDLVILGGGMGGYVAAIRAKQLGLSVALVEEKLIGGTCLHQGCIPTKTLLKSASIYQTILNSQKFGIESSRPKIDFSTIQKRKKQVVEQLFQGLQFLMKKNQIDIYQGFGRLLGPSIFSPMPGAISVQYADTKENTILIGEQVIIATGTKTIELESLPFDGEFILSSDDALLLEELPESITIVGGGVIGVEWASMLNDFGVDVTLVESESHLLPSFDQDLSNAIEKEFKQKGINILTDTLVVTTDQKNQDHVTVHLKQKESEHTIQSSKVLVAIGRKANVNDIGIENTSIELSQAGFIKVNEYYQTKESHIYAVGDCIGGQQLAHVAAHEGKMAVEHMTDLTEKLAQTTYAPSCVYSQPEIATVGLSEQEVMDKKINYQTKKLSFSSIGKALVNGNDSGFIKMIIDQDTNDLIGVHMVGEQVTELISEAGLAMLLDATATEIGLAIHPHPSLSEAIQEVALAVDNQPIHTI